MSLKNILSISLSFVGLLVGAGFATGQEVVQYFTSFGLPGVWGIIVAGIVMTLAGTVFLQLGRPKDVKYCTTSWPVAKPCLYKKYKKIS